MYGGTVSGVRFGVGGMHGLALEGRFGQKFVLCQKLARVVGLAL